MPDFSTVVFSFNGHQRLLPYCLRSVSANAPLSSEIILVWDDYVRWAPIDFDRLRLDTGVPFRVVLQSEIMIWPDCIGRWGWIKQQLAKLYCWKYVNTEYTWIVDGDVLITGDPKLFYNQHAILRFDSKKSVPDEYKFFAEKYLGISVFQPNTFVGSTAIWKNSFCQSLEKRCIGQSGFDLVQAVEDLLSHNHPELPFSEFEYYGHHVSSTPNVVIEEENWNYVPFEQRWDLPIQIMWADNDSKDLDRRYDNLMQHRAPLIA